jgi:hypothetical protein
VPGEMLGKFAGRNSRGCVGKYSTISLRFQMWFPLVRTSAPAEKKSSAIRGVTPKPDAEFSQLMMQRSISRCARMSASRS